MIEVVIDSIRESLVSTQRLVMLRDADGDVQLPIWIGPCESNAITIELQDHELARPMTHDLLKIVVEEMGGSLSHILISELREAVFHANLYVKLDDEPIVIDCRPSDAIALAVRAKVPIYVADQVMQEAGLAPEPDISEIPTDPEPEEVESTDADPKLDAGLDAFRDFLDELGDE